MSDKRILITGAGGYIGSRLAARLAERHAVFGIDIHVPPKPPIQMQRMDIRDPDLGAVMQQWQITHVVHLAAVLEDSGDPERDYDIDVNGTRNVLNACCDAGVRHLLVTSSGAAYGYHADNAPWLDEDQPLRGHPAFAYSRHKLAVEELLADYRARFPHLQQLILRPGTVLGDNTRNLITNLFAKKRLLAIRGSDSPFVFIWDQDVIAIIERGIEEDRAGIFNLAGDGAMTIDEIAAVLNKPVLRLPAGLLSTVLRIGRLLNIGRYGPEQLDFLRYRPVLANERLKNDFGYVPEKTSRQTFEFFVEHARARGDL